MSLLFSYFNLLITKEAKEKIIFKINAIKNCRDLSDLSLDLSLTDLTVLRLNYDDISHEKSMWENIAKLSINLSTDFDFFKHFHFESQFDTPIYKELLGGLGYVYEGGIWKCKRKPDPSFVQTNVFMYCLHNYMSGKISKGDDGHGTISMRCPFCECEMSFGNGKCGVCNSSVEEMKNIQKIESIIRERSQSTDFEERRRRLNELTGVNTCTAYSKSTSTTPEIMEADIDRHNMIAFKKETEDSIKDEDNSGKECSSNESRVWDSISQYEENNNDNTFISDKEYSRKENELKEEKAEVKCTEYTLGKCDYDYHEDSDCEEKRENSEDVPRYDVEFSAGSCASSEERKIDGGDVIQSPMIDLPEDKWACEKCSFFNSLGNMLCAVCSNKAPQINKWQCEYCTFSNDGSEESCMICGKERVKVELVSYFDRQASLQRQMSDRISALEKREPKTTEVKRRSTLPPRRLPKVVKQPQWICIYCGMDNDPNVSICRTCVNQR